MSDENQEIDSKQVRDLLASFYDHAYLQRHPLAARLIQPDHMEAQTRAKELRRILLDAIEQLNPGDNVSLRAPERRPYAILYGLYVEGTPPQELADFIGISERQLRRDRRAAIEAVTSILADHLLTTPGSPKPLADVLHQEAALLAQQREPVAVGRLISELVPMLGEMAREHGVSVTTDLVGQQVFATTNRTLLRQVLITLTSEALARLDLGLISYNLWLNCGTDCLTVEIKLSCAAQAQETLSGFIDDVLALPEIQTLAEALACRLDKAYASDQTVSIDLVLPIMEETTVLVIDDNESLFELFSRYTMGLHYRLVHADSVAQALEQLEAERPDCITLDVMMPHQDGWEMLQLLKSNPRTAEIPVIVCSVLVQPELAYQQGAVDYLQKPIEQADLLRALSRTEALTRAGGLGPTSPASSSAD